MIVVSIFRTITLVRAGGGPSTELEPVPAGRYGPAGLVATKPERELMKQWDALPPEQRPTGVGH